ncbi:hypothetical protein [Polaromonas sp. UC242_47]|uniref:hypothetical protein n=1 Tax=Polaromonas sp. UC242_47 TaxID=3374626 RepID=UPI0037AB26A8
MAERLRRINSPDGDGFSRAALAALAACPLIAKRDVTGTGMVYRFDLQIQGGKETGFFDL